MTIRYQIIIIIIITIMVITMEIMVENQGNMVMDIKEH